MFARQKSRGKYKGKARKTLLEPGAEYDNTVLDDLLEGCQIIGYDWRYLYLNDAAASHGRRTKEELLGHTMMEMYPGIEGTEMFSKLQNCLEKRISHRMENEFTYPDGTKCWFELRIEPVPEGIFILSLDISERKQVEQRIKYLNSALLALRNINQLIIREKSRKRLIQKSCNLMVENRGFLSAWILLLDEKGKFVSAAGAGSEEMQTAFLNQLKHGNYPLCVDRILKYEASFAICEMIVKDRQDCLPRRFSDSGKGFISRLEYDGKIYGVISAYVPLSMVHDQEEQSLFQELAGDIACALASMEGEKERERLNEELRLGDGRYHDLFDNTNDLIQSVAPDGRFLYANKAWRKKLGYSEKELVNLKIWDIIHPDSMNHCMEMFRKVISGENITDIQAIFVAKDGKPINVEGNAHCRFVDGKPVGTQGIFRDVTERKIAEEALQERERFMDNIIEQSPNPLWISDAQGMVIRINPALKELLKITDEEIVGKYNVLEDEQVIEQGFLPMVESVFKEGKTVNFTIDYYTGKGRKLALSRTVHKIIDVVISPIKGGDGKVINAVCLEKDVTNQKLIERSLQESEEQLRQLFDNMSNGVAVYKAIDNGQDFVFVHFNKAGEKIEKIRRDDVIGKSVLDIFPQVREFGLFEVLQRVWHTGKPEEFPIAFYKDNRISGWRDNYVYKLPSGIVVAIYQDMTTHKQAEEALRESEDRYRTIVDNAYDGIILQEASGKILAFNKEAGRVFGIKVDEALQHTSTSRNWNTIREDGSEFPGEEHPSMITLSTGKPCRDVIMGVKQDSGEVAWLNINTSPLFKEKESKPYAVVVSFADITHGKLANEKIRESEEKLKSVVDNSTDQIFMVDRDYRYLLVNNNLAESISRHPNDIVGKKISEIYPENAALQFLQNINRVFETGSSISIEEPIPVIGPDLYFSTNIYPIKDAEGNVFAVSGIVRDITHIKKTENSLRESEIRYRTLFEDSMDAIYITTRGGSFLEINSAMCKLLGYSKEELLSMPVVKIYKNASDRTTYINNLEVNGFVEDYDLQFRRKDGSIIDVVVTANTWTLPGGEIGGYRGIARDITERKRIASERAQYNEELLKSMRAAVEAIAAMTEMRDPYTAGHQKRVAQLAVAIAQEMGLLGYRIECIRLASTIHDIGKITIPAEILSKPGRLSDLEYSLIKKHPEAAAKIIRPIKFPWQVADVIVKHHERLDGSGYPAGLKEDQICTEAKIIAVADVVEAMSSHRPYRATLGIESALEEIQKNKGILFDESVVEACVKLFKKEKFRFE